MGRITASRAALASTLLWPALFPPPGGAQEVTLRFRPEPGTALVIRQETRQDGVVDLGPMGTQQFLSEMTLESAMRVLDGTSAGGRRLEQSVERVAMTVRQGAQEILSVDTAEAGPADAASEPFVAMVGNAFVVEIDERGRPVAVEGADRLFSNLKAEGEEGRKAAALVRQAFSDEALLQMMQSALPAFPEGPITPGSEWSQRQEIQNAMLGTIVVDRDFTFQGVEEAAGEECARLAVALAVDMDFNALLGRLSSQMGNGMKATADMAPIETTGSMCIALADGVTLSSELAPEVSLTMRFAAADQQPVKMKMALKQTVLQTATRKTLD
ncbi:MAG: DUF6263 family protein [Thermoanaerobaculia bacterium]